MGCFNDANGAVKHLYAYLCFGQNAIMLAVMNKDAYTYSSSPYGHPRSGVPHIDVIRRCQGTKSIVLRKKRFNFTNDSALDPFLVHVTRCDIIKQASLTPPLANSRNYVNTRKPECND